jgi:Methyltransferase domain
VDVWDALQFHGDKSLMKQDSYPDAYHRHFSRFQGSPVTMVEIGVLGGGSLQMWRTYFGPQSRIIGLDIDPKCREHAGDGIEIFIGDQADRAFLGSLADEVGPIDLVVDDGGHEKEQQITSFEVLFPRLSPRGVYACEDVHSSYLPSFGSGRSGRPHEGSFIAYTKELIDELHTWFSEGAEPTDFTRSTISIHIYTSLVIFERAPREPPKAIGSYDQNLFSMPVADIRTLWATRS